MNLRPSWKTVLMLLTLCGVCFTAGAASKRNAPPKTEAVYENLKPLVDALDTILQAYVDEEKTKPQELIYGAIDGMVQTLDPFSQFLRPKDFEDLQTETSGEFGGLGIEITMKGGRLLIVTPIEGTPADRVGLKAGDQILTIDGKSTEGISLQQAVQKLRGKKGTKVTITVGRKGLTKPLTFTITRDIIKIESIRAYRLREKIAYIRISEFIKGTSNDFFKAWKEQNKDGEIKGLVVDLRNDPGGLLDEAVKTADFIVPKNKTIVFVRNRKDLAEKGEGSAYKAGGGPKIEVPIVLLVNEGSASGAEILAGALQDHHLAVLVGTKTFGKASVQTIFPLGETDSALRLTTAKYFTPNNRSIHGEGIAPDLPLPPHPLTESSLKVLSGDFVERFVEKEKKAFEKVDVSTGLGRSLLDRFFAFCVNEDPHLLKEELAENLDRLETALVLEAIRVTQGEKAARRAALDRDEQVAAAIDILKAEGKIPAKWKELSKKAVAAAEKKQNEE